MKNIKYCKKCVMPNTRPGISFNSEGICSACVNYDNRDNIDYDERFKELEKLCDKYRGMNGKNGFDCAIAVSGGKDSHFQVHIMKEKLGMNPILFTVEDNFTATKAGAHNLKNISEEFGCNIISIKPNIKLQKALMRKTFEKYGKPTWFLDRLIYTYPLHMSLKFNTPLLVYGENVSFEYGGQDEKEVYSAREILKNGVASDIPMEELVDEKLGITEKDLYLTIAPTKEELDKLDPIYLSYFIKWNSHSNYIFAKNRGFHDLTHEWNRSMNAENYDQVDSVGYLVHAWLKYPKFGHGCATDYTSRYIRYGMLTREEAIDIVKKRDHLLDVNCVRDFCQFTGYRESEFWNIIDKFYDRDLFEKNSFGEWVLKNPLWK
ncbi:N-acetyl sugar amidotransferase [uncultured Tyzzerella sp.]|uniref:N-acetyl sugar amidotransferase n=1 Tax=uncultured Tyzzerella sp. TaxID=2321398 RepID=UPI0029431B89|nr:N-acetyl sugar amidotransferase [uncultured Tyzzerella sp.]